MLPLVSEKKPDSQGVQVVAPSSAEVPGSQRVGVVVPGKHDLPGGHDAGVDVPSVGQYFPEGQVWQTVLPPVEEKVPPGHDVQSVIEELVVPGLYVPALQAVGVVEPGGQKLPALQGDGVIAPGAQTLPPGQVVQLAFPWSGL